MDEVVKKIRELVLKNAEIEEEFDINFDGLDGLIEEFESYDSLVNLVIRLVKGNSNEFVR